MRMLMPLLEKTMAPFTIRYDTSMSYSSLSPFLCVGVGVGVSGRVLKFMQLDFFLTVLISCECPLGKLETQEKEAPLQWTICTQKVLWIPIIMVMVVDFKISINAYLKELINSPVRSLSDIIAFNQNNHELVSSPISNELPLTPHKMGDSYSLADVTFFIWCGCHFHWISV